MHLWRRRAAGRLRREFPTLRVLNEAELWIVAHGGGCADQPNLASQAKLMLSAANQFPADAGMLIRHIDRQIGQIAGVMEVGDGSGDTDELIAIPRRDGEIRVPKHAFHALSIMDRTSLSQR